MSSSIFLNNRYIVSDLMFNAIKEAYKGTLMIGRNPFVVLFVEIEPHMVDFNVHPKKLEVRFEDDQFIANRIYHVVRDFVEDKFINQGEKYLETDLQQYSSEGKGGQIKGSEEELKQVVTEKRQSNSQQSNSEAIIKIRQETQSAEISNNTQNTFRKEQTGLAFEEKGSLKTEKKDQFKSMKSKPDKKVQLHLTDHIKLDSLEQISEKETYLRNKYLKFDNFPHLKLISSTGQLSNNIYIVLEGINQNGEAGLYILDQHAASERINKEFFYRQFASSKIQTQSLISPLKIQLSPRESFFLQDYIDEIKKLGFVLEHFGGHTFVLRGIPIIYGRILDEAVIREIIEDITEIGREQTFSEVKEKIINYLACHRSIRGGDDLSLKDIRKLVIQLANCKDSYHCAHGRPTLQFFSFKELDKLFKRT
jgi:DNA mismatch repair protein MutL